MSFSKQQLLKNSVWTLIELSVYPVLMIVAAPVFIRQLGIEQYGLWMLITNITLGVNVLNIGVGDTNIRLISQYRAQNDAASVQKVAQHNFSLALFLCFCAVLAGSVFYSTGFIGIFYKSADQQLANTLLLMACFSTGVKFIEIAVLSVFKAFERFDMNSKLMLLSKNSVLLVSLVLVLLGYKLAAVFALTVLINCVNVMIQLMVLYRFDKALISLPSFVFLKQKLDKLNYNFWYWLQSVIGLLGYLADKLVVAYFTDIKTLGYYSIASLIGTQIHNFFMAFGGFIFPRVSYKLASESGITPMYFAVRGLIALPGWLITGFLIVGGDVVFRLWLGEETYLHSIFFIKLYLAFISFLLLGITPFYFINGTTMIRLNSLFELFLRGSHFLCMIAGFYLYGVSGILFGLLVSTLVCVPVQYFFFHRFVIPAAGKFQHLLVILPALCLVALVFSKSVIFELSLVIGFIVLCKLIYFDPAQRYSTSHLLSGGFFARPKAE